MGGVCTFNEDVVSRILREQSACLYGLVLVGMVLVSVELWPRPCAVMVHLSLHLHQTVVQMLPLQETFQLILREVSRTLETPCHTPC